MAAAYAVFPVCGFAQSPGLLPDMVVLAERQNRDAGAPVAEWTREDLREALPRTLDELLARKPSFSLYRRQSAMFGNPTSAGVSLRNTGATAASRTLVLLDGIPQNDPFGGWVYWARYDAAALDAVRIVPSSRAAVWGNQSPAGVIQLSGNAPFQNRHVLKTGGGSHGTFAVSRVHQIANEDKTRALSFSAFGLHSDGFFAVPPSQRGPIDRRLDLTLAGADLKFAWLAAPGLTVEPMFSYYSEERGNGTPLAENSTDAIDLALRLTSESGREVSWQALGYHQRREFEAVFSSVASDRASEGLALNQFDVPGRGTGGAFVWQRKGTGNWAVSAGADARHITGETHEDVGVFRRREAGGEQAFAGLFTALGYRPNEFTRVDASLRLDAWQLTDGRRIESSLQSGLPLRADFYADRDGLEPSAALEIRWDLREDLEARASVGTGFRLPTLNELHRPFRVRNDIVEANPQLDPERFVSMEGGLDWNPGGNFILRASAFHHWISDAIANVPVTDPAEISALFGMIPPGGSGSQRRNVDEARVFGVQAELEWCPHDALTFGLAGIWSDTEFTRSSGQPLLEGKPFPQAADARFVASGEWRASEQLSLFAGWEYGASQFDDALAARPIPDYASTRIGVSWRTEQAIYQVRVENLFNEEIQTGLSSDGIRTLAGPRVLWAGAEWEF